MNEIPEKTAVLLNFHHLRVMLRRRAIDKCVESNDDSCFKWYFQKVAPRPMNPLLLGRQCCFGFRRCSGFGARSGILSDLGWCFISMVVEEQWLWSIRRLLGESLGYSWAETGLTSPLCASGRGMHMGLGPACRPDCWPLTRNPFLEASWNKVQRHHWQLKYSFISICVTYQKIYQHFHSFTHSFIPSKFTIFGKRFPMFFPKCAAA